MKIYILTLFPNEMGNFFLKGIFKKAVEKKIFEIDFVDLRSFALDKYKKVDDTPCGGNQGMILKPDIVAQAIYSIKDYTKFKIIYPCPKGVIFDQKIASNYLNEEGLIILCGYYEGVDERIFKLFNIEKISLGNFVLSSGELPSLMIVETILRLLPDVVGKKKSIEDDSIISGLLEYPQYTKPRTVFGLDVPAVLINGHHLEQEKWQKKEALKNTLFNKPSLFENYCFADNDKNILMQILKEE
ncbi:MAG: tRNA (guanosine(37)-N1)-methyltransferase TrmD [Candidatus Margulisiibacteriota bacterium]